jgi:hypothetical protein
MGKAEVELKDSNTQILKNSRIQEFKNSRIQEFKSQESGARSLRLQNKEMRGIDRHVKDAEFLAPITCRTPEF